MREPSRGSGWKEGRKGRAEEGKETVGSWGKPGPGGTLPASAVHTSFPAQAAQRAGRLQPGPRERGQGPGPAPPRSLGCLPRSPRVSARQPPAFSRRGGEKSPLPGGLRGRGTPVAGRRGCFPSRDEGRVAWGKPTGPGWCCPRPAPPTSPPERGRRPWAPRSGMRTDCTWDHPAKGGCGFWDEVVPTLRWKFPTKSCPCRASFSCDATHPVPPWQNRQFSYSPGQNTAH